jgi:hypothetical protein
MTVAPVQVSIKLILNSSDLIAHNAQIITAIASASSAGDIRRAIIVCGHHCSNQ